MLLNDWNIQSRAHTCTVTGKHFGPGDRVYSALYKRRNVYERVDLCQEAWNARNDNIAPLSAWQSEYTPPPAAPPETLKKDTAEGLLRGLIQENNPASTNARYILALMLERKKLLRPIDRQQPDPENPAQTLIVYEHTKTSEVWLILDPDLKLTDLQKVQEEVAALLTTS